MELTNATWRKSTYSSGNGGACVEVAVLPEPADGGLCTVAVRDSKDPAGPALAFTATEWRAFSAAIREASTAC